MITVPIKLLDADAKVPTQAREYDAGYDLYSIDGFDLYPGQRRLFKTGVALMIPPGYYGRICPRSGLALKNGIDTLAGVIDSGYRNDVSVVLINLGEREVLVNRGDRIAQIVFQRCEEVSFPVVDELISTERGANGYGSSGV